MQISSKNIKCSRPRMSCLYCTIHNFSDSSDQYAECICPDLVYGMCSVPIEYYPRPLSYIFSCQRCKHYLSRFNKQLSLFD